MYKSIEQKCLQGIEIFELILSGLSKYYKRTCNVHEWIPKQIGIALFPLISPTPVFKLKLPVNKNKYR